MAEPIGVGAVGFDRERLERLHRATLEVVERVAGLRSPDPATDDAGASLGATESFLRDEWLPTIRAILATDVFVRPVNTRSPTGVEPDPGPGACPLDGFGPVPPPPGDAADPVDLVDLVEVLMAQVVSEHAAHDLDHPFWTGAGADHLDTLRRRLLDDPRALNPLLALPAAAAVLGLLLDRGPPLPPPVRHRLAIHVLGSPVPGTFAETALADEAVGRAAGVLDGDVDAIEALLLDVDATVDVLDRGHVTPTRLGRWIAELAESVATGRHDEQRSVDLLQSLSRLAAREAFGPVAPPALARPIAVFTGAILPRLAAGRTPGGPFLYPPVAGRRSGDEWIRRDDLRELIGIALRDRTATGALLGDVRRAVRTAAGSPTPGLEVARIDELARIVDEAVRHEGAEAAALAAAQREWLTSMSAGLGAAAAAIGGRSGPLANVAAGAVAHAFSELGDVVAADDELPFDSVRTYYEMTRGFEIRRRAVLDAEPPVPDGADLDAARAALRVADGHLGDELGAGVHAANVAWLEFEDASEPFVDASAVPAMRW